MNRVSFHRRPTLKGGSTMNYHLGRITTVQAGISYTLNNI